MAIFCRDAQTAVEAAVGIPHDPADVASSLGSDAILLDQVGKSQLASTTRAFASVIYALNGRGPVMNVFLEDDVSAPQRRNIEEELRRLPGLVAIAYMSKSAAYQRAASIMAGETWFSGVSSDTFPATFRARFASRAHPTASVGTLQRSVGVRDVTATQAVVDDLPSLRRFRLATLDACPGLDLWPADPPQ